MTARLSNSQVNDLGDRLREGPAAEADLRLLDGYRKSFHTAYEAVIGPIRDKLGLEPSGRRAKTDAAIIAKLRREKIPLRQIRDIAGCRIVVPGCADQDQAIESVCGLFPDAKIIDRRENPNHGYRAIHVIVRIEGKPVEVQIRTGLQHAWAQHSELLADAFDHAIKYGSGDESIQLQLLDASALGRATEEYEQHLTRFRARLEDSIFGEDNEDATLAVQVRLDLFLSNLDRLVNIRDNFREHLYKEGWLAR